MKTQTIPWPACFRQKSGTARSLALPHTWLPRVPGVVASMMPALLLTLLTAWALDAGATAFVAAAWWSLGFVFLALALENNGSDSALLAGSGLMMMLLAWLTSRVAPGFGVLGGFLAATWLAWSVFGRIGFRTGDRAESPAASSA